MNITELIMNFRAGLVCLIPSAERVGLPWKRPDSYDEWDNLASAVYRALVIEPLRSSLSGARGERFDAPDYDMLLSSYAGRSVIEVLPGDSGDGIRVFHALGTTVKPLDTVEWRFVAPTGVPRSDLLESTPVSDVRFAFRNRLDDPLSSRIEEVVLHSQCS